MTSHLLPTYARVDLSFERGEGAWLIATDGERYLDFTAGVAVNALGHAHPHLIEALNAQAHKVWHVSNLFRIPEAERLAERLCAATFADLVFFCNSGAEAMECAIKVARKYQFVSGHPERTRIITFEGAFHGRTLATLAAGGQKKYLEGFGPVVEGFDQVPFGDFEAVKRAIGPETAAILIEPIQGEGGVRVVPTPFLKGLRELCDTQGLLLVFDEVQTGVGRTGSFFAYQRCGVTPDVMGVAKALGGGFPVGACLTTAEAGKGMTAGTHGSTFGANPLAMAVGNAVLDIVLAPGFLENVQRSAILFRQRLAEIRDRHPGVISEVRGEGLLIGLVAACPNGELVAALRAEKLLGAAAGDNVVRMLPPLIVGEPEISEAVQRIDRAATNIERSQRERAAAADEVMSAEPRHFLELIDIAPGELRGIIEDSRAMKAHIPDPGSPIAGKMLATIFDKPSTRTRVSFDVAMRQLGGETIVLTGQEMQLGRGETIADTARVLSRYVDAIMIRTLEHNMLLELAQYATVPVINGLTRRSHPCQIMADVMTFEERRGPIRGRKVAWTGDANNVLNSWMHAARQFDFELAVATPPELAPKRKMLEWVKSSGAKIEIGHDPEIAVKSADCIVTDTWVSMGDKDGARRHNLLRPYQVNGALMAKAKSDAIFLHCLPAHRGDEVTDDVIDGPQSAVFDEAENRLHAQKGILVWCFNTSSR